MAFAAYILSSNYLCTAHKGNSRGKGYVWYNSPNKVKGQEMGHLKVQWQEKMKSLEDTYMN